jgi:hypothetical protein
VTLLLGPHKFIATFFENDAMKIDEFKNKQDVPAQKKKTTA